MTTKFKIRTVGALRKTGHWKDPGEQWGFRADDKVAVHEDGSIRYLPNNTRITPPKSYGCFDFWSWADTGVKCYFKY